MDMATQPTQQATQGATQKYLVEKFTQEQIDNNIVCRVICTTGSRPIQDLRVDINKVILEKESIKKKWIFGRNPDSDYHLGNIMRLSSKHFMIMLGEDGNLLLKDTSTNGTWLNSHRMEKNNNQILSQGDEISVGLPVESDTVNLVIFINEKFKYALELANADHLNKNGIKSKIPGLSNTSFAESLQQGIFKDFAINDEVVGTGAFATVKKAVERTTGKTFAVKIINKRKVMGNLSGVSRELDILQKLKHDRIVRLKGFYQDNDNYYLVMEFVSGGDLMDFVAAHGAVGEDAGREITRQILEAVAYMHAKGISHRDLKPDNILIEQDDPVLVKITDFGLAKVQDNTTFMKTFCGTLAYVAPEVISGKIDNSQDENTIEYSSMVDMWSLGCLVYVILTGHLPFSGSTQNELYKQINRASYHEGPLREFRISSEARDFIESLIQVDPNKRLSAKEALNHKWIKLGLLSQESFSNSVGNSQISLSQSSSQQKILENMNDEEFENVKAQRKQQVEKLKQIEEKEEMQKSQEKENQFKDGFRVPDGQVIRLTQSKPTEASNAIAQIKSKSPLNNNKKIIKNGVFLILEPIKDSLVTKNINIKQGSNPFVFGRSDSCNASIRDSRLSRVHSIIYKARHITGNSVYESPAMGLDDIWYYQNGSNFGVVNDVKLEKGKKAIIHDGDIIKIFSDRFSKETIAFKVRIVDDTGLFNNGYAMENEKTEAIYMTDNEVNLMKTIMTKIEEQSLRGKRKRVSSSQQLSQHESFSIDKNYSKNKQPTSSLPRDEESNIVSPDIEPRSEVEKEIMEDLMERFYASDEEKPVKKSKRARLDPSDTASANMQFY